MVTLRLARLLSPISATYTQLPPGHAATEISSQSSTVAFGMRTRPRHWPDASTACRRGCPESLCDQITPGVRRLSAAPLASGSPLSGFDAPAAAQTSGLARSAEAGAPSTQAVTTTARATTAALGR